MAVKRLTVGIFSKDGQDNYKWLVNLLRTAMFQSVVECVLNVYITNNFRVFTDALTQCQFAILYHTKNRGRLNITNVTDSLYDEELENMKDLLGDNVVVLVDDLEESRDHIKKRILGEQPLIKECARDLILISEPEKQAANLTGSDPRWSPAPISQSMQDAYDSIHNKIYRLRTYMEEAMGDSPGHRIQNGSHPTDPTVKDYSSNSDTQSEGYKSSATTRSVSYRQQDVDSVRSSTAYSSDRSSRPFINSQRSDRHDGIPATREESRVSLHVDGTLMEGGDQERSKGPKSRNVSDGQSAQI
ncbi:uncharacterized protein ACMZJ9_009834 [Mantella aurantiaca]